MKRCPNCKRTYEDDTLGFCLEDGAPLVREPSAGPDSEATLVTPSPDVSGGASPLLSTQAYNQLPGRPTVSPSQAPGVPGPYPGYVAPPAQRRVWPWVLGIGAVLFIAIMVIVAAAIILPNVVPSPNANLPDPSPLPIASPSVVYEPSPIASPQVFKGDDVPTDEDEVLEQLKELEDEWEQANVDGDKETLERILADEYTGDGNPSKQAYLNSLKPKPGRRWSYSDLELELDGSRAILTGRLDRTTAEGTDSSSFVDTFVWRDRRWQATSSRSSRLQ